MRYLIIVLSVTISLLLNGCGVYNFTGASPVNAKTFQVNYFQNNAPLVEPGIERTFTLELQDIIQSQTNFLCSIKNWLVLLLLVVVILIQQTTTLNLG